MAEVELIGVSKRFGRTGALRRVSVRVTEGEYAVFVGPSGCGKSTLLRLVAGLDEPDEGEIRIGGERADRLPPRRRGVAMVFQSYALYPHMTAEQNMAFALRAAGLSRAETAARIRAVAGTLDIGPLLGRRPASLSGGQRQRVAIGRALVREPRVLLLDEPLSNLDASLRARMRVELAELHRQHGQTTIHVTHDQAEAMTLADRLVLLRQGRIEQEGPPMELYRRPASLFVAEFLGSPPMNLLAGTLHSAYPEEATVRLELGASVSVPVDARALPRGAPVTLGVRPEHLRLTDVDSGLAAEVLAVQRLGAEAHVHLALAGGGRVAVTMRGEPGVRPGERVGVSGSAADTHLFDPDGLAVGGR